MSLLNPKDHIKAPQSIEDNLDYPYAESDDTYCERRKLHNKPFTNALLARGFRLDKSRKSIKWRGNSGAHFELWWVREGDENWSKDFLNQILTAIDMGARTVDTAEQGVRYD